MDKLKTVNTFVQVARSGNLARAAKELGLSRSLVSSHLRQLEDHLGILLVKRTTRSLVLTEAGKKYLKSCTAVMNELLAAEGRLAAEQQRISGQLKVMASMAFGTLHLSRIIMDFTHHYKEVRISLILLDRGFAASDFLEGDFDVGLSMDELTEGSLISSKIREMRWIACAGREYSTNRPPLKTLDDLSAHNCLVHRSYSPNSIWRFRGPDGDRDVPVSGSMFTNSAVVLKDAVTANHGIAMLPLYGVRDEIDRGIISRVLPDFEGTTRPLYLVYQDSRYLPYRARVFIDFLKKQLKSQVF